MRRLLAKLKQQFPDLRYAAGERFCWSPESDEIFYKDGAVGPKATWSLLHETGHALLTHASYETDFELLQMEVAAWSKAQELGEKFDITIDQNHIEDCLDTYRDWLYQRSICPSCSTKSMQADDFTHYRCFNCHTTWRVSANRFGRSYRRSKNVPQSPVFHSNQE